MKVLFLDIDGVMNNYTSRNFKDKFSVSAVQALNSLLAREPDLKIVISSAWRIWGVNYMKKVFTQNGLDESRIIDRTGDENGRRGYQIQCWLDRNPGVTHMVILDDESDMDPFMDKLAKTSMFVGLTSKEVDQAVEVLKKPLK